jgi:hypothetical protein
MLSGLPKTEAGRRERCMETSQKKRAIVARKAGGKKLKHL